jgi:glycosyltransferase involved in cell wall biosynthesis
MNTRFGFVSTYPPTQCGLATFASALRGALVERSDHGPVVRLVETGQPRPSMEVVAQIVMGEPESLRQGVSHLNGCDVAIVQHEYGVYGGPDGDEAVALLGALRVPSIVVLHTVLDAPTANQRTVLESVVDNADAVVVMTQSAFDRLVAGYVVDPAKVEIIAHGASDVSGSAMAPNFRSGRFTVLTWGLLGPGKGIELGIDAMALLTDVNPPPRYLVAGQTHPKVLMHQGEQYRNSLIDQVNRLGLQTTVSLDGRYRDGAELAELVRSADAVLLPYDSTDQVTSGVLIEAVAAGKPVVATQFPHARELLVDGAGLVVPHRDPEAIAAALRSLITNDGLLASMSRAAAAQAPHLRWSAVAAQYRELSSQLIARRLAA